MVGKGYTDISTILEWYSSQSAQLVTTIVEIIFEALKSLVGHIKSSVQVT